MPDDTPSIPPRFTGREYLLGRLIVVDIDVWERADPHPDEDAYMAQMRIGIPFFPKRITEPEPMPAFQARGVYKNNKVIEEHD